MSYLYDLTNDFLNKISKDCDDCTVESSYLNVTKCLIEHMIRRNYYDIINTKVNYYDFVMRHCIDEISDIDFLCDALSDTTFFLLPKIHGNNNEEFRDYCDKQKEELLQSLTKIVIVNYVLKYFIVLVRKYYFEDFMRGNISVNMFCAKQLLFRAKKITFYSHYKDNSTIVEDCEETNNQRSDLLSSFIDSEVTKEDILKQQERYIIEFTYLMNLMKTKGNITDLEEKEFNDLLEFITNLKNAAVNKMMLINNSRIKTSSNFACK